MIHDTEYWLAEMERMEKHEGLPWLKLRQAMTASIREEQAPVTHEDLLANARECVDRDLERAGWRGVMAYAGTAIGRMWRQHEDTEERVFTALGHLAMIASCEQADTCHSTCMCMTCPHAKWPDSPVAGKTDTEQHNPAPEEQKADGGEAGAVEKAVVELLTAEIDRLRMRMEAAKDDRDIYRERAEQAEATIRVILNSAGDHIPDAGEITLDCGCLMCLAFREQAAKFHADEEAEND